MPARAWPYVEARGQPLEVGSLLPVWDPGVNFRLPGLQKYLHLLSHLPSPQIHVFLLRFSMKNESDSQYRLYFSIYNFSGFIWYSWL